MIENLHRIVAFDGLSLAGKSTMVGMLEKRSINAEVVRENTYDPYRKTTSLVNKELKTNRLVNAVESAIREFPESEKLLIDALTYARSYSPAIRKQPLLAYMFTAGRKDVDGHVRESVRTRDVILDRWQVTGWAYQVDPAGYTWQDIRKLNQDFGISMPDVQIILTCSVEQIPLRKAYREKEGVGTSGQMGAGKEHIILPAFQEIYDALSGSMPVEMIENAGIPTPDLVDQIRQAIQAYGRIENLVRNSGSAIDDSSLNNPEQFWLNQESLERIEGRQKR